MGRKRDKKLAEDGYDPKFGARPLRRAVERHIEDPLAEELLRNRFAGAAGIRAALDSGKVIFFPTEPVKAARSRKKSS